MSDAPFSPSRCPIGLRAEQLGPATDSLIPRFETSAELLPLAREEGQYGLGQDRASRAIRFGIAIERPGYNLFLLGPTGAGKKSLARAHLEKVAASKSIPPDWCYVQDFSDEDRPRAFSVPAGVGARLQRDMQRFVEDLGDALNAVFESDDYRARSESLESEYKKKQDAAIEELQASARSRSMAVLKSEMGYAVAPLRDGEVIGPEDFESLPDEEREQLKAALAELEEELETSLKLTPKWEAEYRERLRQLNSEVANRAIEHLVEDLRANYEEIPVVEEHLDAVCKDILEHVNHMIRQRSREEEENDTMLSSRRYLINLLIDSSKLEGAPVVFEDHPTHGNVIGRVDSRQEMGVMHTDFLLVKSGALHRANGGYLLLDAGKLLAQPSAYEALKRALRSNEIRIESVAESVGLGGAANLSPQNIPLDTKVILFGERELYYALSEMDPDFCELFKVAVDFDDTLPLTADNARLFAGFIADLAHDKKALPLSHDATSDILWHACRLAEDQRKLLCHVESLANLLYEADFHAKQGGAAAITRGHIQLAREAHIERSRRIRDAVYESIARGTVMIDTHGSKVGQVNALSVVQAGDFAFGRPSRISAVVRFGAGQIVDVEREVELGGPLHSKGILILTSYVGARYAANESLAMRASLVFEQSYGGVDGDSASAAELFALLSALARVPLRQDLALTGSVNQLGEIQAIGGVNEKIEGFYAVAKASGLSGSQGVIIPHANLDHLVLHREIVAAVQDGQFHIYTMRTVDEGIALLSSPSGQAPPCGEDLESLTRDFHTKVKLRLRKWARTATREASGKSAKSKLASKK